MQHLDLGRERGQSVGEEGLRGEEGEQRGGGEREREWWRKCVVKRRGGREERLEVRGLRKSHGEVVEERLELGRGLDAESLQGDESALDRVDVLESPTQLEEEEDVVGQFLGIDEVRGRVEEEARDVMKTLLLQEKTTTHSCQKRSHVIVRSGFIQRFPPLQVEWVHVKRLRKTKGNGTYHERILDRVADIVEFEGERGALAIAHVKELIFKRQVLENRLLHALCAGIHSLRDGDEPLDCVPFLCSNDGITSSIHSPPVISRSWRFGSNHRAGSIAIPHFG